MEKTFRVDVVDLQKGILTVDLELFAFESQQLLTLHIKCTLKKVALGFRFHLRKQREVEEGCPGDSS